MRPASRLQRDLQWCLSSAPLTHDAGWSILHSPVALALDLPAPTDPHRFRLGHHFEAMLRAWMAAGDRVELLETNLQVMDGKTTIGEFDFIVRFEGEIEHWEAAIKFYLGAGNRADASRFFGPNTADRLDLKLSRLREHQLRLADHPAAQALLAQKGLQITRSRLFMKGRLFHPWQAAAISPAGINAGHENGWWISHADFLNEFESRPARFVYLPKSYWLAPLTKDDITDPLSFWEIKELFESGQAQQATHLAIVDDAGEISRGFVVSSEWLDRTAD